MRVLFLCHRFLDTQIGGLAEFLHFLPLTLKKWGINSIIYAQNDDHTNKLSTVMTLPNGITCYTGPFVKPSFFGSAKKLKPLLALCKQEHIDIVHAQGIYRAGYMAMKAHEKNNVPYIVTSHNDILATGSDRIKRRNVRKRCSEILKHANGVTHLTPIMEQAANDLFDTHTKSTIIANGIDLNAWQGFRNIPEKNYFVAIGRLEKSKGFHVLLDAISKLHKLGKNTSLIIAGSGPEEKNLQRQARHLGLNIQTGLHEDLPEKSIIFTGYIQGETKLKLMAEAHAILFASQPKMIGEAFGIVQIEAMAAGKPLIASDIPATRYLQHQGLQAMTVEADNANAWTNAMHELLENKDSRIVMGKTNLQNATQFDWDVIAKKYLEAYQQAIETK